MAPAPGGAMHLALPALPSGAPLGYAVTQSSTLVGLDPRPIRVEVSCTRGPPFFQLVGLAQAAVRESRVRAASALSRLGVLLDEYALTVNLAPADLRKSGASLDLAVAVAVLAATGKIPAEGAGAPLLLGELALDGALRPIRGVLPQVAGARDRGIPVAVVPEANRAEAGLVSGIDVRVARTLDELVRHLRGAAPLPRAGATPYSPAEPAGLDLAEVRGQPLARRALEVAAAGGHDLLLLGPPGGGKTLLARRLPTLLPPLAFAEAVEVTTIHSVAGLVDPTVGVVASRPFRAPHHTVTAAGLVGGGDVPRPGELSLAHHGVLFLDELAEFRREALEALRGPLEDGVVTVARVRATARFPARPLFVAATNLCPCGLLGHPTRVCRCSDLARRAYLSRLSGPLLDRIDLHVRVPPVELSALVGGSPGEASAPVRARVARARARQEARLREGEVSAPLNARLTPRELDRVAPLDPASRALLSAAADRLGLSARAFTKIRRVARTLADLGDRDVVTAAEVAEAIQGRVLDGGRA